MKIYRRFCCIFAICVMTVLCAACHSNKKEVLSTGDVEGNITTEEAAEHEAASETTGTTETDTATTEAEIKTTEADTEISEEDSYVLKAEEIMSGMTLRDKICQMLFVNPESITGADCVTIAGETTEAALVKYPVGGIMYSKKNFISISQTTEMIANTQAYSDIDLFIAADEEGGVVNRLMSTLGTTYISSMYTYKDDGVDTAYNNALTIATDMSELGFNLDFAPVCDVWSNPENTVIGKRAYSDDFEQAAELISYAVDGFHAGNLMCTLKHFPGHGDTSEDSHYSAAYVNKTEEELLDEELLPFMSGIEAGADFVMVGHLIVPDMDDVPATLSEEIVTGLLREELGYDGIVITDSLIMSAVAESYTAEEVAVMAVKAGCDMLLEPTDIDATIEAIEEAVSTGELTEDRIDESVRRILIVKLKNGLNTDTPS